MYKTERLKWSNPLEDKPSIKRPKKSQSSIEHDREHLKVPQKTIAANSIVVKIGDFKAQSKLDRDQMRDMDKKRRQKRQEAKSKSRAHDPDRNVDKGLALGENEASAFGSESGVPILGINLASHLSKRDGSSNPSDKNQMQTLKVPNLTKKRGMPTNKKQTQSLYFPAMNQQSAS